MAHRDRIGMSSTVGVIVSVAILISLCAGASAAAAGEWTKTGGPWSERGNVRVLAVDQGVAGTAYAVIAAAGLHEVYRTENAGGEWTSVHAFRQTIGSLVARNGVLYAGATGAQSGETAIWRSADAGDTWEPVYTATADTDVRALALAPDSTEDGYAAVATAAGGAMLKTTDGVTWSAAAAKEGSFDAIAVAPTDATIVFAAGNDAGNKAHVYRSTDGGAEWAPVLTSETEFFDDLLVIDPNDSDTALVKTRGEGCCPPPAAKLWRTTDGGGTWEVIAQRGLYVPVFAGPSAIYDLQNGERTLNAFEAAPVWTATAAVLPEQVPTYGAADAQSRSPADDPLLYIGFSVEGVYTSNDGLSTVQPSHEGFRNLLESRIIAVDPQDPANVLVVTKQSGYKSANGGTDWTPVRPDSYEDNPTFPLSFAVKPDDQDIILMGVEEFVGEGGEAVAGRTIHRSTDGGASWTAVYTGTSSAFSVVSFGVAFDPSEPSRAYALSGSEAPATPLQTAVLKSTDGGVTWTPLTTIPGRFPGMSVLRVDPEGVVYVAGRTWDPATAALFRSDDQGATWQQTYTGNGAMIYDLTYDPANPDDVYMIEPNALLKSRDRGVTWETILESEATLGAVVHDPGIPGRLYLGMGGPVVLMCLDGGATWVELENWEDTLTAPAVMSMAVGGDRLERTLYVGLDGVWRYVLAGTSDALGPDSGGTVTATSPAGITTTVEVPAGAVAESTELLYTPGAAPVEWLDSAGFLFAGQAFTLDAYVDGSHVADYAFQEPVTVTIHYDEDDIAGLHEASLALQLWDDGAWIDATQTCDPALEPVRNLEENWLSVSICHLSYYALAGRPGYSVNVPMVMR